jgi:hypothetical protein
MWSHEPNATQEAEIRRIVVGSQPGQIVQETLSQKCPMQNMPGGVAQVLEACLASRKPQVHTSVLPKKKKKNHGSTKAQVAKAVLSKKSNAYLQFIIKISW